MSYLIRDDDDYLRATGDPRDEGRDRDDDDFCGDGDDDEPGAPRPLLYGLWLLLAVAGVLSVALLALGLRAGAWREVGLYVLAALVVGLAAVVLGWRGRA